MGHNYSTNKNLIKMIATKKYMFLSAAEFCCIVPGLEMKK